MTLRQIADFSAARSLLGGAAILALASCGSTPGGGEGPEPVGTGLSVGSTADRRGADRGPTRIGTPRAGGDQAAAIPVVLTENRTLAGREEDTVTALAPQLFRGRAPSRPARLFAREEATSASTRRVALNFDGAEISEVAGIILGDILKVNYTVDPAVTGQIRLKSTEPVPVSVALGILETSLRQNNAALVVDGDLYRIVPADQALGFSSVPELVNSRRPIPPGFSIRIVPLRHISATEMTKILEPFVGTSGVTRVDEGRNLLVLAGTRPELKLWLETIETFDVDWFANKSVGLYPLTEATADSVIKELRRIFGLQPDAPRGALEFLPIERLNAVMAIANDPSYLDRVRVWVDRLDAGSPTGRRLFVYRMKHAKAVELAPVLAELFNPGGGPIPVPNGPGFGAGSPLAPGLSPITMSTTGGSTTLPVNTQTVGSNGSSLTPSLMSTNVGVPPLPPPVAAQAFGSADGIQIVANLASNSLIVKGTASEYRAIEEALRKLDVPPLQVLVEATVVEVTITDELRFGVQYFLDLGNIDGEMVTATLSGGAAPAAGVVEQIFPTFPGFSAVTGTPARVILDALEGITEINIVSSPNLMVLDNQTASLVVGDEVPVAVQQQSPALVEDDVLVSTIEFRNTGVIFQVTPRINIGGTITLDIVQEVSSAVQTTEAGTLTPTISQRRIESSVVTESGETVVLGGLFSETASKSKSGIPFLQRIPFLGWLFRQTSRTVDQTELLVLISPKVVSNQAQARMLTQEMKERISDLTLAKDPFR